MLYVFQNLSSWAISVGIFFLSNHSTPGPSHRLLLTNTLGCLVSLRRIIISIIASCRFIIRFRGLFIVVRFFMTPYWGRLIS